MCCLQCSPNGWTPLTHLQPMHGNLLFPIFTNVTKTCAKRKIGFCGPQGHLARDYDGHAQGGCSPLVGTKILWKLTMLEKLASFKTFSLLEHELLNSIIFPFANTSSYWLAKLWATLPTLACVDGTAVQLMVVLLSGIERSTYTFPYHKTCFPVHFIQIY